jgi:hypothetical protein
MVEYFQLRTALDVIKKLGLELKEENFFEMTEEDFQQVRAYGGPNLDPTRRWFTVYHKAMKTTKDFPIVTEEERYYLLKAVEYIYKMTEGMEFDSFGERLFYAQGTLPPVSTGRKIEGGGEIIELPIKNREE